MDFGAFCELEPGLTTLLHSSELSWTKKNVSAKKMFKVGDEIDCVITEIDKEKRRVAISHRLTQENPFETFENKYPVGTIVEGEVVNKNEYSLFVKIEDLDVDAFLHCNDLTYLNNGEEELAKYKKGEQDQQRALEQTAAQGKAQAEAAEAASGAEIKKNESALKTQKSLEQLKIDGKSQILQQEAAIKEKLMQLEFRYCKLKM